MAKKEKLKTDEFDFDEDLNFDDLGFGDGDGFEVKDDRVPVVKVLDGAVEGAKDTLTDPGFIRKTVLESLPKEYGETYAKVDEVGTGVVRLYNDAVKEVKPTVTRVLKQVDKLIPQESKRTREFLEKIKELVGEDYDYKSLSKEQQEEQSIQNSLGAIFQTQGEEQVRQRHEDQAQELIQNQVEKDRFEKEVDLMGSIDNNLAKLTQYNEKINQAYQKKTLELQFRGYFLQQDMLATTKKYFEVFEKQNEAITKNTALPEFVKITRAESFKEHMREKFNSSVTSGLFGDNDFVKKGFERLGEALKSKLREFKSGVEEGVSAASEAKSAFASEEEGGMGVDKYDFVGKMLGSQGIEKLGEVIGKRIREKFDSSDSEWAQKVKKMGFKGATAAGNLPGFLSNIRNSEALQTNWEDGTLKSMLKEATGWVLDQFTEQTPDMSLAAAPGMNKLGAPAIFDNKVHRSITEIIPGFLSRILQELQISRTGDSSVPLTRFDLDNGTFSTTKKLTEKIKAKLKSDALSTGYDRMLDETANKFMGETKFDGKTKEVLKNYLRDLSFEGGEFNPKDMLNEEFLSKVPASKRKAFKKFIEDNYTQDTVDSAKNNFVFSTDMVNLRKTIADQRGSIQTFENAGYGDILRDIGLVGNDRSDLAINMPAYKKLLLSDKDERKLAAKEAYQSAADGKPVQDETRPKYSESGEALRPSESYKPGSSVKIEEVSLEPITKRLDSIIENMKDSPKDGTALSDIRAKKGISKFDPKQALENIKNTKVFKWMYKKGRGDGQAHVGPMAQDVNKYMGDEAAPEGTSIDLVSLNGNNMAAIEALRQEQEVIKEKVGTAKQPTPKQKPASLLEAIKQDTGTITDLLSNKGIVIGSFPSIEFNTDGVEKLAKAFSDSMADYKERSFEFFESMQKKLSEVSGFGMSMPDMPSFKKLKETKAAKKAAEFSGKFKEKAKVVGSSMWAGTKSLFNFGKERAKDTGVFLKRQYQEKKDPVKAGIGRVFKSSFDIAGSVLRGANRIVAETLPAGIREVKDLLKTVRDKALDILDQPVDIYVLGNPNPVMQALLMKMGHYFDQATGKPITKPSQIVGPVVDRSGNYVLTAQDFATGIVDKDGNKIESPVKKLIGIGVRAVANGISVANNMARNILSLGKGGGEKLLEGFRGMVKKLLPTDILGFGFDKSHKVLLDIREILNRRLPGDPMSFSDTFKPEPGSVVKESVGTKAFQPQQSLFPDTEETVRKDNQPQPTAAEKQPSVVATKIAESKAKTRSLFTRAKNAVNQTVKDLKQKAPTKQETVTKAQTLFDKLNGVVKQASENLKQKFSAEVPTKEIGSENIDSWVTRAKNFAKETRQAIQQKLPGQVTPEVNTKPAGSFVDNLKTKSKDLKQKATDFLGQISQPRIVAPQLDLFPEESNKRSVRISEAAATVKDVTKQATDKAKKWLTNTQEQLQTKLAAKIPQKQKLEIPGPIKTSTLKIKEKAEKLLAQSKEKAKQVSESKWSPKPLLEKLRSPKKSLSDFASDISGWLQKESGEKEDKRNVDDIEVKVSEPTSVSGKQIKEDKKSVFERITEFTVSGKGKFAELVGGKLANGIKAGRFSKMFGGAKDSDNDGIPDVLEKEGKSPATADSADVSPKYIGSGLFSNLKQTVADKLNAAKQSRVGSTVADALSNRGTDVKEKIGGLFSRLKESGIKAKTLMADKIKARQTEQGVLPTGPQLAPTLPTPTGLLGGIKGRAGRLVGSATGLFGGALGALGNLLPGNKDQAPQQGIQPKEEKPGALDEIKDLLSGLFKRREGPEIEQGKSRFNDRDSDGDRDGNVQEQFDKIEARKKERDAQTDKTVASLDPKYRSSENIIDTMINKAKGLMGGGGIAGAAGAGGSLLGTAADVAGGLFGRGGRNAPQTTVPGGVPNTPAKTPSKLGRFLKGGAKIGLGAGATYGLFHLAEKARENGDETTSDALSMAGNAAGLYSAFQVLRGGAGLLAGAGGAAGAAGAATSGALGATGAVASGAASVGGSFLGGAASAVMAALASPWVAIPAAVALTGYLGYKGYKYLNRNKASPAEAFRMAQYGLAKSSSDFYHRVYGLEEYFNKNAIGYSDGKAYIIDKNVKPEEFLKILEVDINDKRTLDNSLSWFMTRFKPIYLSHLTALLGVDRKLRLEDLNDLPKDKLDIYLNAVEYPEGPYNVLISPFKELPSLTAGPSEVSQAFKDAKAGQKTDAKKPTLGKPLEGKDKTDSAKIPEATKETSAVSDIANGLLAGATLGKYNSFGDIKLPSWKDAKEAATSVVDKTTGFLNQNAPGLIAGAKQAGAGVADVANGLLAGATLGKYNSFGDIKLPSWKEVSDYSTRAVGDTKRYVDETLPGVIPAAKTLGTKALNTVDEIKDSIEYRTQTALDRTPAGSLVPTSADPIIAPVQNNILDNIGSAGLAAGGLGLAGAMALGKKKAVPTPQPVTEPVQAAQQQTTSQKLNSTVPPQTPGQKPSLFSKVKSFGSKLGSVVKSRGLKLGLAGGAAYGLFHLAEKARENGNETLSDALSMGGNAAGAYGAFQGLSGIASMMAGTGGVTGALGTAGTAISSGVGALGSGAAAAGGSFLGGVGSVLGAVALNPLFYVPAAVGLLGYGGYKAYKAFKRVKPSPTTKLRLTQYGFNEQASDHYSKVLKLEEYLNKEVIGYNGGQAYLIEKNIRPETVFNILGVSPTDAEGRSRALQWFTTRFKPVYLNHLTTLYSVAPKARLEDIDGLTEDQKYRYLSGAQMPDGPYNELLSPFPELPRLPADSVAVAEAYRQAVTKDGKTTGVGKQSMLEPTQARKLELAPKSPTQDIVQKEAEIKQQVAEDTVKKVSTALSIASVTDSVKKFFVTPTPQFSTKIVKNNTSDLTALEAIRFKMYGLLEMRPSEVSALRAMESSMYDFVQINANLEVSVNVDGPSVLENLGGMFGVSMQSDYGQRWLRWYFKRFLPTFTTFIGNAYKAAPTTKYADLETFLKPSAQYDVALALSGLNRLWTVDEGPYADRPANRNPFTIDKNLAYLKANIGKEKVGEKAASEALLLPTKPQLPIAPPVAVPDSGNYKSEPAKATPLTSSGAATNYESSSDDNFPLPASKPQTSLRARTPDSISSVEPDSEEVISNKVDKPPKKKASPIGAPIQPSVKPPPIPEAPGPMKSGVGGAKYVKKADSGVNLEGLNPLLAKHLLGMSQEFGEKTGQSVVINSAYRSYAQQEALHRANPKKAARPGRSLHEKGLAVDINEKTVNKLESLGLMRKYGFTRPVGQEGWHVEPAGVQVNINKARNDPQFATQAIAVSPGRGGGGAWNLPGIKKYGRNQQVALATFNAGTTTPLDTSGTGPSKNTSTVLPSKKEPPEQLVAKATPQGGAPETPAKTQASNTPPKPTGYGGSRAIPDIIPNGGLQPSKPSVATAVPTDAEPTKMQGKSRSDKGKESVKEIIAGAAKKAGVQPDYLQTIAAIESALNPQAASPTGEAVGLFQFQPKTWKYITQKTGHKYGITPATPRTDPYSSTLMAAEYAKANEQVIKKYKTNPTAADFYLPHFMGPTGGLRVVKANPNQLASEVNPDAAANPGNSSMFFKDKARTQPFTVSEFYNNIVNKLKKRANEFGIKFTDKFYDQGDYKQTKVADTTGSREEAELATQTNTRITGYNKDKEQPGLVPGTVSDKPNRYPVFAQTKPTQPVREFDQYSTGNNKSGEYKISEVEVTDTEEPERTNSVSRASQPTPVSQPVLKPITGLDTQAQSPEVAKQVPAYEKSTPSLTGMVNSVFGSVLGTGKAPPARDVGNNSNLASGINTTAVILNESLSVQRQMLDVLKGILVKTTTQVSRQVPEVKPQPTVKATVAETPIQAEPVEVKQEKGLFANIFGNSPEALPKPAVSLKRTLA